MGIRGLTDRGAQYPKIGTLRKGAPKPDKGPGRDLRYFRFESNDKEARDAWGHFYPGEPTAVNIFLPYATTAENFDAWQEEWVRGGLIHRCDGVTCVMWKDGPVYRRAGVDGLEGVPCPGNCKQVGRLTVIIQEFQRLATVTVLTTSIHDILSIQESLEAAEALRGDLRGIPFILSRRPEMVSMPGMGDKRQRVEKWMLHLEIHPSWVARQLAVQKQAALPGSDIKLLSDGSAVHQATGERVDVPDAEEGEYEEEREPTPEERHTELLKRLGTLRQRERVLGGQNPHLGSKADVEAWPNTALEVEIANTEARITALEGKQPTAATA